jgi:Txe/YoeB family toxin of Txe-Axe toxin-antitoxin module
MKNQKFIALIVLTFLVVACGKKNEPTTKTEKPIVEIMVFKTEQEYFNTIGNSNDDASLVSRNKFAAKVSDYKRPGIQIDEIMIGEVKKSSYADTGKIEILNTAYNKPYDEKISGAHRIYCILTKEQSDKFMEKNIRGKVKMTGIINDYSQYTGLWVDTCTIESVP